MYRKLALFLCLMLLMSWGNIARAGFGISPPYVKTEKPVFAGSHFEQRITLLRSSADTDMDAQISIKAPEIESWISIKNGNTFDLPKGALQVPMIVAVDVPKDAEIGNYKGYINIRMAPKGASGGSGVAIALGARVDIDVDVTDQAMLDFIVSQINIPDFEVFKRPWNWKIFSMFFYRIKVGLDLENTGNTKIAPTNVHIDVYDLAEKNLLESHDDTSIEQVEPFERKIVYASYPTKLAAGSYWGHIKVYKDKSVVRKEKISFTVFPPGGSPTGVKMGFWPWFMLSAIVLVILLFIVLLIKLRSWRAVFRVLYIVFWPLIMILRLLKGLLKKLNKKFWRWMGKKASRYQ